MKNKDNKPQADKKTWDFSEIQARRNYKNALRNWEMGSNVYSWEHIQEMGEK